MGNPISINERGGTGYPPPSPPPLLHYHTIIIPRLGIKLFKKKTKEPRYFKCRAADPRGVEPDPDMDPTLQKNQDQDPNY